MAEPQPGRQGMDPVHLLPLRKIVDHLDLPVVTSISQGGVAVPRYFVIQFRDGRDDGVRVKVAVGGGVGETDDVAMCDVFELIVWVVGWFIPSREHHPVVVVIFIMIACHLLLSRTDRIRLYMGVEQATAPAHVFERYL